MGHKIRDRREKLMMTQEQLAEKSGISRQTISLIETEKLENITLATMRSIAAALDSTVEDIFFNHGD